MTISDFFEKYVRHLCNYINSMVTSLLEALNLDSTYLPRNPNGPNKRSTPAKNWGNTVTGFKYEYVYLYNLHQKQQPKKPLKRVLCVWIPHICIIPRHSGLSVPAPKRRKSWKFQPKKCRPKMIKYSTWKANNWCFCLGNPWDFFTLINVKIDGLCFDTARKII